jgi:putative ABC transport system permease protein
VIRLAWRLLVGRPGLAWLALACIAVGVAARGAVTGSVGAVEARLANEARALIAADLEVSSTRPLSDDLLATVTATLPPGARTAQARSLTAMASAGNAAVLCEVNAVGHGWPLAGNLLGEPADSAAALHGAEPVVLADPDLLPRLGVAVGDQLTLGTGRFRVVGTIAAEPGAGGNPFRLGPRLYANLAALETSGLSGSGIRARHLLLATLPDPATAQATAVRLRVALDLPADQGEGLGGGPSQSPVTVRSAQEAARQGARAAGRAADLLRLVALFALALGALGVAALAVGMMRNQAEDLATLRVLGATRRRAATIFLLQALLIGGVGGALGSGLGALLAVGACLVMGVPPAWPQGPEIAMGLGLGVVAALAATTLPALALARMAPLAVLRGEPPAAVPRGLGLAVLVVAAGLAALAAALESRSWTIGPAVAGGAALVALMMAGLGRLVLPLFARLHPRSFALRHGLANLGRNGQRPAALVVALGLAAALGAALLTMRASFDGELSPGRMTARPGFFAIDVQDDQREAFAAALTAQGLAPNLRPQVRGRLTALDGIAASAIPVGTSREAERATLLRRREQNLTWAATPGPGETLVAGRWPAAVGECAVQDRWAETLGVGLGSRLAFDVQGVPVEAVITGLRRIDWWTFQPNFFISLHPDALAGAPAVWVGTVPALPRDQRRALAAGLARDFPNVSLIDVADAADAVRAGIDRASAAVAAIAAIALLAGLAVVAGTAAAGARERRSEAALIRALGGCASTVALAVATEFTAAALPAAVLGAAAGIAGGHLLAGTILDAQVVLPWVWLALLVAILPAAAALTALGAARSAWRAPPLAVLREE